MIKHTIFAALLAVCITGARADGDTLAHIKASNSITLGYRESSIPFSYLDDQEKPIGYSMDLCLKVVDAIKQQLHLPQLQVNLTAVTSQTRIPLMINGTVDLECGSTTNSVERQKQVAFSVAHYITSVRMLVKANSGIKRLEDLKGRTVVTTTGTTSDRYIQQDEHGEHLNIQNKYGKDHAESFLMVDTGHADAFVMDDILLAGLIANAKNPKDYAIVGPALSVEPYGLMLRRDDPAFKKIVDDTLIGLMKSGAIVQIYDKWFTHPIPPKNINLNLPMSEQLKQAIAHPTDKGV